MGEEENDLRELKLKRCRQKADNREEWSSAAKKANVLKGSSSL
jgi:hypothetical protein